MNEKEIVQHLIRSLMFYGLTRSWDVKKLKEVYEYLELPEDIVDETLNEGIEH